MSSKKKIPAKVLQTVESALEAIIDQWYLSVSDYYVTQENVAERSETNGVEELKRFHDSTGHRIKFNKGDLDFTFGLSLDVTDEGCYLQASVNNKVPNLDYGDLIRRLSTYYENARIKPIEGLKRSGKILNGEVFILQDELQNSIVVEQREGKADIIRLSFEVSEDLLKELVADSTVCMEAIHQYCVAPLRRVYAEVFRTKHR